MISRKPTALASVSFCAVFFLFSTALGEVVFPVNQPAHIVAKPDSPLQHRVVERLVDYFRLVNKEAPKIVAAVEEVPEGSPAVVLSCTSGSPDRDRVPEGSDEAFALWTESRRGRRLIMAVARTEIGLKRAVQRLVMQSRQRAGSLEFPEMELRETPWIPEREWAVCPWVPQHVRGAFVNPYADTRMNIWKYSDEQLAAYVEMYDWFGYSGAQLMETAYSYSVMGSPEAFQGRQRKLAELLKENGQNASLWLWAAEFSGYGWLDPAVTYTPAAGQTAFTDPSVRRSFEKYYDHYARLAPYVDRVIGHFYDPGHLENRQDVFNYMRLLEEKFRARNPAIKMSIDAWAAGIDYLEALAENGFTDYLLLEMTMPHLFKPGERERYHEKARTLGLKIGLWGWYTTEYETDQLASMYVNAELLKDFYNRLKGGALQIHPASYWSEMEAHHLNNIYSMYAASQLLWNPERDPHQILAELTEAIWGPDSGQKVLSALELIQDVRSGPRWETYWWTLPDYRLGTRDPSRDLTRAERNLDELENLRPDPGYVTKIPLPFPPETFVDLMLPHLRQIQEFARFRIKVQEIRQKGRAGAPVSELARMLESAWQPIPEFDTWIGTFGQPEARMQEQIVREVEKEFGITVKTPGWWKDVETQRLLEKIQNMQRRERQAWTFDATSVNEFHWRPEKLAERLQTLVQRGWLTKTAEASYRLTNWEYYRNFR